MERGDRKDIIGGTLMTLLGIAVVAYSASHYQLGQLFRMGPGMVPVMLGCLLVVLGVLIVIPALSRSGGPIVVAWRPAAAIFGSMAVFAILIGPFGLIPAVVALIAVSVLAEEAVDWRRSAILALALSAGAVLIFPVGLGILIPIIRWPF